MAVAKWDDFKRHRDAFIEFGINPTYAGTNHKNASDIALTVECMSALYEGQYDVFVIYAGDGGFGPLVSALLDKGKEVYLCSVRGSTSELLTRLSQQHTWFQDEWQGDLQDIQSPVVNPLCKEIVKTLHSLYTKCKMTYVTRKYLLDKIIEYSATYGSQDYESAGLLLNEARDNLGLIFEEPAQHPKGGQFTIVKINYNNEIVKSLRLRQYG